MRRSVRDRTGFDYIGTITRIDSVDTSNNHRVTLGWDRFLSKRLFLNLVGLEWYRDPFQNVANRWTVTAGLGYEIVDTARTSWSATAGPAWQSTDWDSAPPAARTPPSSFALRVGTRFDHEFTGSIDFHAYYNAFFTDEASGSYTHHFDTGLEDRAGRRPRRQRRLGVGPGSGSATARGRQLPQAGRHAAHLRPRLVVLDRGAA